MTLMIYPNFEIDTPKSFFYLRHWFILPLRLHHHHFLIILFLSFYIFITSTDSKTLLFLHILIFLLQSCDIVSRIEDVSNFENMKPKVVKLERLEERNIW